ncbi:Glycosyltransferase involved in cell wall bisynthesis [Friedmanniella luteola]|uniref:Glycosyltransferase involved in cell wall bisynthesis n=1 Tax=Friedmanniella luteola TaxID=546871 RepID=A0A1H1ZUD6_9ACTN|nr:Glycosyltransferase involved in cell wall bisynthesis [Friedmanniella luteola]
MAAPALGAWTPTATVTVVLPAKDCQGELELTLAALAEQTYPEHLLDVVVVDDGSEVPLELPPRRPAHCRILRLPPGAGHGSGGARHAGAQDGVGSGDLLLFLDADMVATRTHVEAHARWHHVVADAVVLGRKSFVDFDGISPGAVQRAVREDTLATVLAGRPQERHVWWENFVRAGHLLTDYTDDTFVAVVGASVSTTRALYRESGGFSALRLRGIVDTEFGYRIFTAGGVVIPDLESESYHQGVRNFSTRGDEIKRERIGLAANHLPIPIFRPVNRGRSWTVPEVHVLLDAGPGIDPASVLLSVDSLLASSVSDLRVTVSCPASDPPPRWLLDYFDGDGRVRFTDAAPSTGFPSPSTLVVPAGAVVPVDLVGALRAEQLARQVGLVRATVPGLAGASVELWATRALHRARRHPHPDGIEAAVQDLFGQAWLSGAALGLRAGVLDVTRQGMLLDRPVQDATG